MSASLELRTHYLTPTFTKLNLLGLLHTAWASPYTAPVSLEQRGHGFSVKVRTTDARLATRSLFDELLQALNSHTVRELVDKASRHALEPLTRYSYVGNQIDSINKHAQGTRNNIEDFKNIICSERVHVRKSGKGGSPTLILAPDLGKFSTAGLPYKGVYPDATDHEKLKISVCTLLALTGLAFCALRAVFIEETKRNIYCAFLSPFASLGYREIRALYWSGRRLSALSPHFWETGRSPPSTLALFAALSPVILDASPRGAVQHAEFVTYVVTVERNKQYVRSQESLWAGYAARLPVDLAGAMLARLSDIPRLLVHAPDFFNLLGEYLTTGDDRIYLEALRELASSVHSLKREKSTENLSRTAAFLLSRAAR